MKWKNRRKIQKWRVLVKMKNSLYQKPPAFFSKKPFYSDNFEDDVEDFVDTT